MSSWFPVNLNLAGRKCLVAGGGRVAHRKVLSLLDFGGDVILLAPDLTGDLAALASAGKIAWVRDEYRASYLEGCFLAVAATGLREVNRRIAEDCRSRGILVNVSDAPAEGDFNFSAYLKRGDLLLAVSSGGNSPYLTKEIIRDLARVYGSEYASFVALLGEARAIARKNISDRSMRRAVLKRMVQSDVLQLIKTGRMEEARKRVMECLSLSLD